MDSPILVTGGTGRLGRLVVARLRAQDRPVRVLARHERATAPGAAFFAGDLRTGAGVEAAVRGAGAIVHCATGPKGDADATANLVGAAVRAGAPHLVFVSIVGIERIATWGYPKAKLAAESIVQRSGLPWTLLRVTQFYEYILANSRALARLPVAPVPAGFRVRPVAADDVAARLAELACGDARGRAGEFAGPAETDWLDLLRSYLIATHRRRWVLPVRIPGTRAVRNGALLPSGGFEVGSRTWAEFLAERVSPARRDAAATRPR